MLNMAKGMFTPPLVKQFGFLKRVNLPLKLLALWLSATLALSAAYLTSQASTRLESEYWGLLPYLYTMGFFTVLIFATQALLSSRLGSFTSFALALVAGTVLATGFLWVVLNLNGQLRSETPVSLYTFVFLGCFALTVFSAGMALIVNVVKVFVKTGVKIYRYVHQKAVLKFMNKNA